MSNQIQLAIPLANDSTDGSEPSSTTPPPATGNGTGGWLGLDSTQVLIIFLIIVAAVLVIFLLIYYYVIKGMRQRTVNKLVVQKSASGSIGEEKARNIFAHPERHLAVDQSTRMNPDSPASVGSLEQQKTPPTSSEKEVIPPQAQSSQPTSQLTAVSTAQSTFQPTAQSTAQLTQQSSTSDGQQSVAPVPSNQTSSQSLITRTSKQPMIQTSKIVSSQTIKADKRDDSRKSNSSGKKRRSQKGSNQIDISENNSHRLGVLGALAGVRNTLKDTDQF